MKLRFNKNTRTYIEKLSKEKSSISKSILLWLKQIIICSIPIINIFYAGTLMWLSLFASEYTIIKMLKEQKEKTDREKMKIEKIISE